MLIAAFAQAILGSPSHAQTDCSAWNSTNFFEVVTVADVDRCLTAGADPNARGSYGFTPLHSHSAAEIGAAEAINTLLAAGADLEARNESDKTPLHVAVEAGADEGVNALLAAGADPKARDEDGLTPFDRATENDKLQRTEAYWRLNDAQFR